MGEVRALLGLLIGALELLLLGRVLMSWVNPRYDSALGRFLYDATEPFLAPIRRAMPSTGMVDWSPLVAFIALALIASVIGVQ